MFPASYFAAAYFPTGWRGAAPSAGAGVHFADAYFPAGEFSPYFARRSALAAGGVDVAVSGLAAHTVLGVPTVEVGAIRIIGGWGGRRRRPRVPVPSVGISITLTGLSLRTQVSIPTVVAGGRVRVVGVALRTTFSPVTVTAEGPQDEAPSRLAFALDDTLPATRERRDDWAQPSLVAVRVPRRPPQDEPLSPAVSLAFDREWADLQAAWAAEDEDVMALITLGVL